MYKMMKVFDCQDMPQGVRDFFFGGSGQDNGCYIKHEVNPATWYDEDTNTDLPYEDYTILDAWLLSIGALEGEDVLISHWW